MNRIFITAARVILLLASLPAAAAQWQLSKEGNIINSKELSGSVVLAPKGDDICRWYSAWGVELLNTAGAGLAVSKNIGEEAHLLLAYEFPFPVTSLAVESPVFSNVDLAAGEIAVEFAVGKPENFEKLLSWDLSSGYAAGDSLPVMKSDVREIPSGQTSRTVYIRILLRGYAGMTDFTDAGAIFYTMQPDRAGEIDLKLFPDNTKAGHIWRADSPFVFTCAAAAVDSIAVVDAVSGNDAGMVSAIRQGELLRCDLPDLDCGTYDLEFRKTGRETWKYRFVLVPGARKLTFEQMKSSPFGIVGISRTDGFREFKPVDGPAIAKLIGVHQERSSMGGWVNVNGVQGEYNFGMSSAEAANYMASTGILQRCNLAWTPDWAVDHERIKQDGYTGWTGHYPPRDECYDDYEEFCRRLAEHFGDSIIAEYEIWNEPNNEPFASFKGSFDEFVRLCETAARGVHAANPDARMILGTTGDADVGFIARLLRAGLSDGYAIVDIHPYRHTNQGPEDGLLGDINRLKKAVELYGDGQDIIFSEVGWPTTRIDTGSYGKVTEFEQACFNTRQLLISLAAGVKRVHFHMMEDWGSNPDSPEENFGFFKVDGSPKIAVGAMAGTARHLEGASFAGRLDTADFVHAWYWNTPWEKNMVLVTVWGDMQADPDPQDVVLPGCAVMAYNMSGGSVEPERIWFDGMNTVVRPGADPVFIYMPAETVPDLTGLPVDLRPWLKKRAEAPIADTGKLPAFEDFRYPFCDGAELKAMGFAGVESDAARSAAEVSGGNSSSAFDICYDEDAIRFSFVVRNKGPWQNDRSGWWLWAGDCVKIFLGRGNNDFMSAETYQLCFAPTSSNGTPALAVISYDSAGGMGAGEYMPAELFAEQKDDCWLLSCRILWRDLGLMPVKGEIWQLDINGAGGFWNNPGGDSWTNPTRWGELIFL